MGRRDLSRWHHEVVGDTAGPADSFFIIRVPAPLSIEDVRRLIDSAFHVRDTAGQYDTLLLQDNTIWWVVPGTVRGDYLDSVLAPDSCMTVDTIIMPVYIRKTAVTHDRARNERRLWDSTWNIIDTTYRYTKTEGSCE